jgi:two-component system, sensor histidine kinase RegB
MANQVDVPPQRLEQIERRDGTPLRPSVATAGGVGASELFVAQLTPTREHLRQVFVARNVVLVAAIVGVTAEIFQRQSALFSPWIAGILGLLALLNLFTWFRLRQPAPVSYIEFSMQIVADVLLLTAALYYSGGEASPLNDLYLVPLTIAAATLPLRHTLIVALTIVGCHLLACYAPPPGSLKVNDDMVELLTGGLIVYFVFSMAKTSRKHERLLARLREDYLKQQHSREMGTLAAVTADQMSSPLATMAVVVGELREGFPVSSERRQAFDVVANQIQLCKQILSRLLAQVGYDRMDRGGKVQADKFLATIVDKCRLMQPGMVVQCRYDGPTPAPEILANASLEQAILALLGNARSEAPPQLLISGWRDEMRLQIEIRDSRLSVGMGGLDGSSSRARAPDDRPELLMAKTAISQFGGTIENLTHADGRVCVKLSLPLLSRLPEVSASFT